MKSQFPIYSFDNSQISEVKDIIRREGVLYCEYNWPNKDGKIYYSKIELQYPACVYQRVRSVDYPITITVDGRTYTRSDFCSTFVCYKPATEVLIPEIISVSEDLESKAVVIKMAGDYPESIKYLGDTFTKAAHWSGNTHYVFNKKG